MVFRLSYQYCHDLEVAICHYDAIDHDLAKAFFSELEGMEKHLTDFPEAAPLTSEPPIRKFLLKQFPFRIRYVLDNDRILLLTLENMSEDLPL